MTHAVRPAIHAGAALVLLASSSTATGQSDCRLAIRTPRNVVWNSGIGLDYSVFDPTEYLQVVEFEVEHNGGPCEYFITFSEGESGDFSVRTLVDNRRESLRYNLFDSQVKSNILKDLPGASRAETLSGRFAAGEKVATHRYYWSIEPLQMVLPRRQFSDGITLTIWRGTLDDYIRQQSLVVRHRTRVRPEIEVGFYLPGRDSPVSLVDFGELNEGLQRGVEVRVRSNSAYQVALESEGGQALHHTHPRIDSQVHYSVTVSGQAVDLSAGPAIVAAMDNNGGALSTFAIELTIGATAGVVPGLYRDSLIVAVNAE